jgi:hypothetical protein
MNLCLPQPLATGCDTGRIQASIGDLEIAAISCAMNLPDDGAMTV